MANRGQLTKQIKDKSRELLGKEITITELRLMPYVQSCMMNEQRIDPRRINPDERDILSDWRGRGWIEGGADGLAITEDFWNAMNAILWLGYVAYREQPDK